MKAHVTALALVALGSFSPSALLAHSGGLPVGDGQISTSPVTGSVMSCQQTFNPNAGGAFASGDWLKDGKWYPELKPTVDGAVAWSGGGLTVAVSGSKRKLSTNSLPTHTTGIYPVQKTDDAYQYDRNPNKIKQQTVSMTLPANPKVAAAPSCLPMGMIGVALTGVAFYNSLDARGEDAGAHEIQDSCNGHPERSGQYHYHTPSDCMTQSEGLVGYALDGFGIYSVTEGGKTLTNQDLDGCHGHTGTVMWDGKPTEIYHYHLTAEYPYTLGCYKGTPIK
ncbi:MAG: YHYH protein [Rhodobacteraceae bacterium]|nr:YHYH protein [Paracoccaceae bacterium]MCF8516313.1 YHYH protein [Paracoccaceae bacterium]MCF8520663.1 YHYH protein [Paracoccaceae bacterium]